MSFFAEKKSMDEEWGNYFETHRGRVWNIDCVMAALLLAACFFVRKTQEGKKNKS